MKEGINHEAVFRTANNFVIIFPIIIKHHFTVPCLKYSLDDLELYSVFTQLIVPITVIKSQS